MAELFEKFEVNRDPRWQVLLKLVGGSLVLHLAFLWAVIYVPALRDTVNIAALIATSKFVDKDYQATQIGDDIQIVQLEKFRYPEGYFALEAQINGTLPAQSPAVDPFAPKIISQAGSTPNVVPEASPSPTPEVSPSPEASPVALASPSATIAEGAANSNQNTAPLTPEEAQKKLDEVAAQNNVPLPDENQINKKPLKDFAAHANELKNQGQLDLNKPFEIVIEAELDEQGKLKNPRRTKLDGDEKLGDLFVQLIAALNDSGFLVYLQPISKDNPNATIRITVKQGDKDVVASVESEASSPQRAESLTSALNNLLFFGATSRAGKDEEVIMKNTNATQDGKKVVVNFSMPRQSVVDMIKKQMQPGA
ncbi:MAG TPA: hypothetical protein VJM50_12125 [Pyrinomonadaceae bacterium]|nr:hypothetical protein [Pyrinomonadaceae bacterium]